MKKLVISIVLCAASVVPNIALAGLEVKKLRCEYLENPMGLDIAKPRLSWVLKSTDQGQKQTAYRIIVASGKSKLESSTGDLWDSKKVESDQTIHVVYGGKTLKPGTRCWWKVKVWDKNGQESKWSEAATWSMGLFDRKDWGNAKWIADPKDQAIQVSGPMPATMLRKSFNIVGEAERATVYVTGLGTYELRLNGNKVGDHLLAPEFTYYDYRIQYQTYDVTKMIKNGVNGVGAILATGWNGEHFFGMAINIMQNPFQGRRGFIMRLDVELKNGKTVTVVSDKTWKSTRESPVRAAGIYDGYEYDARLQWHRWDTGEFDDGLWRPVIIADYIENPKNHKGEKADDPRLVWQPNQPIRVMHRIKPETMTEPQRGVYIMDMKQNMVGWCNIQVHGRPGTEIRVRHGEMLKEDGTLYTANLRRALQTDRYTRSNDRHSALEPRFTYHGFRYVEITGRPNVPWRYEPGRRIYTPNPKHVIGEVIYSGAPQAGEFECSNRQINRLMDNILWTQRGNMHSVPTDCPQRDERAGWMGDIQAFSQTAIFNMDMAAFFTKWIKDVRDSQLDDGRYPNFAPMDKERFAGGTPAWADAGTIIPWRMYQNYGDVRFLEEHYESARHWVEFVYSKNRHLCWDKHRGSSFNDWLNADKIKHKSESWPKKGAEVPHQLLATAFFAHSTEIVGKMAKVLGKTDDAKKYLDRAKAIKAAFNKRFVKPDGKLEGNTQAGYALALEFDLLPDNLRAKAAKHMVDGFKKYNGHMSTGIQTTHRLMKELTRNGYNEEAYRLVNLKTFPSWGFMMENGATTIWERWDGYVKGRGFQDPTMNSFNHVAFGSVGEWVWRYVVGLNPDESRPGWKHFTVAPKPGGGLTWARGEYESIRGTISSSWKIEVGKFRLEVVVPPNTTATVIMPDGKKKEVLSGKHLLECNC